ncbi:MAG: hypothetical protein P1U88_04880 [Thalassobaculaceae bacterium]|nr:hypothetical protein [Thalassobaculaceae bacterium]
MEPLSVEQVLAEEAAQIHGVTQGEATDALTRLAACLEGDLDRQDKGADSRSGEDEDAHVVADRKAFYRHLNALNSTALCCSGGGIRSATFCLGVIQALAMHKVPAGSDGTPSEEGADPADTTLLGRFHYLSTVSGGGFIGSWLSAWRHHDDFPNVYRNLVGRPDGPNMEPPEISWLRAYSNYLTPRVGLFSADTWAGVAIYVRNLILNWFVIVPVVAFVLLLLKMTATFAVAISHIDHVWWPQFLVLGAGIACLVAAQAFTTRHRPTRRPPPGSSGDGVGTDADDTVFLKGDLVWSLLSAVALTSFLTSSLGTRLIAGSAVYQVILAGAALGAVIFAVGWLAGRSARFDVLDLAHWALSGLVYGGLVGLGAVLFTQLGPHLGEDQDWNWIILVPIIFGVPWVLAAQLFAEMIFVGLISYEINSDADREWLGRAAGWVAATAIVWMVVTFIAFAGAHFLVVVIDARTLVTHIGSAGGLAGIATAWLGRNEGENGGGGSGGGVRAVAAEIAIAIAGPVLAIVLVAGTSGVLDKLLLGDSLVNGLIRPGMSTAEIVFWLTVGLATTGALAAIASRNVNINRFSPHALYRNRLIRAYLGASRQRRRPDRFTGFDAADNIPVHTLWPPKPRPDGRIDRCLFHVVNITLDIVDTSRLAWQQRKAASFTVSALHSGAAYKGYRPSRDYAGPRPPYGISLGTAVAISGAAASPNMGSRSSPSITLLFALLNVRLGWWLGNPGKEGARTYKMEGPATAIRPLLEETLGLTTGSNPYVYLSDGGHFENLGIYEMVRRRCRFILAIDAGRDPDFTFEDLGNAVRKTFIDLGVRITLPGLDALRNHPTAQDLAVDGRDIPYYAIGTIDYRAADGPDCENGVLLYVKPAIHGTDSEGAGVRSYAAANPTFPHQSTSDQWFDESQFESYRSLGLDIMNDILARDRDIKVTPERTLNQFLATLAPTTDAV